MSKATRIRVLILEDNAADAELMITTLRKAGLNVTVDRAETETEFIEGLEAAPDIILADYTLPQFSGLAALELVKVRRPDIPFILISGTIGEERAVEALQLGADDYLLKDRLGRLGRAVSRALERKRLGRELQKLTEAQRETDARFRQIAETVTQVFWLIDPVSYTVLYLSPAYEEVWGRSCASLYESPSSWLQAVHPEDRELVERTTEEELRSGRFDVEYRIIRGDGSMRWIRDCTYLIRNPEGRVTRIAGVAEDITDRKQALRRFETQYAVARALVGTSDLAAATPRILEVIAKSLGFQTGILWEVEPAGDALRCVDIWSDPSMDLGEFPENARRLRMKRGSGIAGEVWNTGRPVWRSDTAAVVDDSDAPRTAREAFNAAGLHCAVAFPIIMNGEIQGVADFFSTKVLEPDPEWLSALTVIGSQLGQFMERRAQHEQIARLNRIHAVLSGINSATIRMRERKPLFRETCRIAVEKGGFHLAWIGVLNSETLGVTPVALHGPEQDLVLIRDTEFSANPDVPGGKGTVGKALRNCGVAYCNDLASEEDLGPALREAVKRGYRGVISLPLFTAGECMGVMVLYSRDAGYFDEPERRLLSDLAGDISYALDFIKSEERVLHLAYHDALTDLPNRARLQARLTEIMDDRRPRRPPFALLLMNINNFRDINDTLGHLNGDLLLKAIAKRLTESLWRSDVVACLGGDEYALLLPQLANKDDIELVVEKIAGALRRPFEVAELPINVDARLGIALYPDHGNSPTLLWQHADVALRAAKTLRLGHVFYSAENDHYDPAQLSLIGGLRDAIDSNELVLHYQPKIDLAGGRTQGIEALLRWQHPERGLIYPDQFIPSVERTNLIDSLTTSVLANALRQGHLWHKQGLPLGISVNLSARNLQNPNLVTEILDLVSSSRFPLDCLTVEITESAFMVNPVQGQRLLSALHEAGIRFAIDDFGIGQASLAYLRDLPVSEVKIDKSFVVDFTASRNAAIVRSAIDLGHNLDLDVTAEGVEDESTYNALKGYGCDSAQGYYFSKPMPADQLVAWLRESRWPCAKPRD